MAIPDRSRCCSTLPGDCHRAAARQLLLARSRARPRRRASGRGAGGGRCRRRVDALLDAGIRQFVDLTEEGERPAPYARRCASAPKREGSAPSHRRFAIRDLGVPSPALMRTILDAIHERDGRGEPVYVHCWAGVGRTGTVVGCLLREQGLTADEALAVIARKWRAMEKCQRHASRRSGRNSSRSSRIGPAMAAAEQDTFASCCTAPRTCKSVPSRERPVYNRMPVRAGLPRIGRHSRGAAGHVR